MTNGRGLDRQGPADADPSAYVPVAAAMQAGGMRLVSTRGVPGPWGEAAKAILHVKKIPYLRVAQETGAENPELVAWTGINSAPIAIWESERPRAGWAEILLLAERVAPDPPLIPRDEADRAAMFGLLHELCGEDGFGWNRRMLSFAAMAQTQPGAGLDDTGFQRLLAKYPVTGTADHARRRLIEIVSFQSRLLRAQAGKGRRFYIGGDLTAADIYAACFAAMVRPLPPEHCAMSPELRAAYTETDPEILAAVDPLLLEHRDFIYRDYLELPLRL